MNVQGASQVVNVTDNETLKPPIIHECIFWDDDDERWRYLSGSNREPGSRMEEFYHYESPDTFKPHHTVDMSTDSYVWCFTGPRGAGKTTAVTYFAMKVDYLYEKRILSNFPIEYYLETMDGKTRLVKAEPLDFYKLLCFDADYQGCLILIDEAPEVISHMSSMTWKNRLLNIFIRQLRKNRNSLMMCAQNFDFIDKSMRWQTDIIVDCKDASRKYGWSPENRGKAILMRLMDNSGQWWGQTYEQAVEKQLRGRWNSNYQDPALKLTLYPRVLWGEEGETKPVFDTFYTQDVFESLRKVDMRFMSYEIGDSRQPEDISSLAWVKRAGPVIQECIELENSTPDCAGVFTRYFYEKMGALTKREKDALAKRMASCNVAVSPQDGTGKRYYSFKQFDLNKFMGMS